MLERPYGALISLPILSVLAVGMFQFSADAQPPPRQRVKKARATPEKTHAAPVEKTRARRAHERKSYVRTRRDYGHVRMTRHHRRDDGRLKIRPIIVRSARVTPIVLDRFEDRKKDQIRLIIQHFRDRQRDRALEAWVRFVESLPDYHEPIDLDEIMLYIAREGCLQADDTFLFHAARLGYLNESAEQLEDYIDSLEDQRDACAHPARHCSSATLRNLDAELIRTRADRRILEIEARVTNDELEKIIESSREYEHMFAATFEDMYREVELRIGFTP